MIMITITIVKKLRIVTMREHVFQPVCLIDSILTIYIFFQQWKKVSTGPLDAGEWRKLQATLVAFSSAAITLNYS